MSTTTTNATGETAREVIDTILGGQSTNQHRFNLSELFISWLLTHGDELPEKKDAMFDTYWMLNEVCILAGKEVNNE